MERLLINILAVSLIAGVGNSVAAETIEKNYKNMKQLMFIFAWIYGWCAITLFCLYQPFMELWVGKNMLLTNDMVLLFVIYFYALCMGLVRAIYVQATGIWWKEKYRAIFETGCNLMFNILFVNIWGLKGIIAGTCISLILINFIYGSRYIFKYYFKNDGLKEYYKTHLLYTVCTIIFGGITWQLCLMINKSCILNFIYRFGICLLIPNLLCIVLIKHTSKWNYITVVFNKVLRHK